VICNCCSKLISDWVDEATLGIRRDSALLALDERKLLIRVLIGSRGASATVQSSESIHRVMERSINSTRRARVFRL